MNLKWTLNDLVLWTNGKTVSQFKTEFSELSTDTRKPCLGKIFIALKGDNYDAHDYLDQAVQQGAGLLIVHRIDERFKGLCEKVSILLVEDTLNALQNWASNYRKKLKAQVFAITGSNGKTTTKEYLAKILSTEKKTYFTDGSFNNHWGLPISLLSADISHECIVLEMGMNHFGEIAKLVSIADPDFVVCTMVGTAHIENFGNIESIAKAKAEIYQNTRSGCVRVFNQDQDLTFDMMYPVAKRYPDSRMLTFSQKNTEADVHLELAAVTGSGLEIFGSIGGLKSKCTVPLFGAHNILNLSAAACMAHAAGIRSERIWAALPLCKSTWGRNEFIQTSEGVEILFDGYNANPDSMKALFANVKGLKTKGKKVAALGQMKELGALSKKFHFDIACAAAESGFDDIYFYGENASDFKSGLDSQKYTNATVEFEFSKFLQDKVKQNLKSGDLLVIKGSRGAKTENYISLLTPIDWKKK